MSVDRGLVELAVEAIAPPGAGSWRAMMGGATLYCDAVPFAIVGDDGLWFKAGAATDATWDAAGAALALDAGRRAAARKRRG